MSLVQQKKKYYIHDTSNRKVNTRSPEPSNYNDNPVMRHESKCKTNPQLIISAVTHKTHNGNIPNSRANISTSGPHGCQFTEYFEGLNELLYMTNLVNPNSVSLCSADFSFLIHPIGAKKDRYTRTVSNMHELPVKGNLSDTHFCATGRLYDDKHHIIGEKKRLVTTDSKRSRMFISDGLAYFPVRFPTDE